MIRHIPSKETKRWTGPYLGSYYGTLWKTFNVDLDRNEGQVGLSRRMELIEDTTELPNLTGVAIKAFLRTDADCTDRYWALTPLDLFKTDSNSDPTPDDDWDTDGLDSSPATCSDMTVHGNDSRNDSGRNKLFVTTDTDISVLNDTGNSAWTGGWWVTKQSQRSLDSDFPHPIEFFPNRKLSLVGDGNLVHTISRASDTQNDTITYARLVLPRDYVVRHIFTTNERAWICCFNRKRESGAVVEWDGFSQSPNKFHSVDGIGAVTGVNFAGVPIVLNEKGVFLEFDGNGFSQMVRNGQLVAFPNSQEAPFSLASGTKMDEVVNFLVASRGMATDERGFVYINMNSVLNVPLQQGAGIWCLNPTTGRLYNKHSLGAWGDSTDYGQQLQTNTSLSGAIYSVPGSVSQRSLLVGGCMGADATASLGGIWLLGNSTSTTPSRGYFVTQYIPADEIREFWDTLWVRFKSFKTSGSSIVVKARGTRPLVTVSGNPILHTITWTSTTTFTVTLSASSDALIVGDEVEIMRGVNAGYLAHVTVISGAHGALQTITIDETGKASSGTASAVFERWKKIGTITNTSVYEQKMNIGIDSSFIQFKVEMRGPAREMELSDLVVTSKSSINLET